MADTARWSLQQFADAAGKRIAPYPHEDAAALAPQDRCCAACGADLLGRYAPNGMPLIYCGKQCAKKANNRWHDRPDESAVLRLTQYYWSEW